MFVEGGYAFSPTVSQDKVNPNPFFRKKRFGLHLFGGRNRTRTCDPIDVNDVLYQLSHATLYLINHTDDDQPVNQTTSDIIPAHGTFVNSFFHVTRTFLCKI